MGVHGRGRRGPENHARVCWSEGIIEKNGVIQEDEGVKLGAQCCGVKRENAHCIASYTKRMRDGAEWVTWRKGCTSEKQEKEQEENAKKEGEKMQYIKKECHSNLCNTSYPSSAGLIVGIVILVLLLIAVALAFFFYGVQIKTRGREYYGLIADCCKRTFSSGKTKETKGENKNKNRNVNKNRIIQRFADVYEDEVEDEFESRKREKKNKKKQNQKTKGKSLEGQVEEEEEEMVKGGKQILKDIP